MGYLFGKAFGCLLGFQARTFGIDGEHIYYYISRRFLHGLRIF